MEIRWQQDTKVNAVLKAPEVVLKSLRTAKAVQKIVLTKPFNKLLTLYYTHRLNQMAKGS